MNKKLSLLTGSIGGLLGALALLLPRPAHAISLFSLSSVGFEHVTRPKSFHFKTQL